MPIPKPKAREKQKDFMIRCVAEMTKEYNREQAVAICYQTYKDKQMAFGKIYETTYWGNGVCDNDIDWGIVYKPLTDCTPTPFFEVLAEDGAFLQTEQNEFIIIE